jgi:hypothetical protein
MTPEQLARFPKLSQCSDDEKQAALDLMRRCHHIWVRHSDGGAICTDCTVRIWANDLRAAGIEGETLAGSTEAQMELSNVAKRIAYA